MTENRKFLPGIVLLGVLWGPTNYALKVAGSSASPLAIASIRWWIAGTVLLLLLQWRPFASLLNLKWPTRKESLFSFAMGALFFAPAQALYPLALKYTTSIEANILFATSPVWTALMALLLLKEKIPGKTWVMVLVGLVGAYLVAVGFEPPRLSAKNTLGNAIYLGAYVWECFSWVLLSRTAKSSSGIGTLAIKIAGAMTAFLVLSLSLSGEHGFHVASLEPSFIWSMGFLIVVPALICFSLWYVLVERAPIVLMSITTIVQPIVGALLGWMFLGEQVGPSAIVGSLVVFCALMLGSMGRAEPMPAEPAP